MSKRILTFLRLLNRAGDPAGGAAGEVYFDTLTSAPRYHNGTTWVGFGGGQGGGGVPTLVQASETYTVPVRTQSLFTVDIEVEGVLDVEGILVEVT